MKKRLKTTALTSALAVLCTVFFGCGKTEEKGEDMYPLDTDVTLTYWMPFTTSLSNKVSNYGDYL